jgi:hypothetical protein
MCVQGLSTSLRGDVQVSIIFPQSSERGLSAGHNVISHESCRFPASSLDLECCSDNSHNSGKQCDGLHLIPEPSLHFHSRNPKVIAQPRTISLFINLKFRLSHACCILRRLMTSTYHKPPRYKYRSTRCILPSSMILCYTKAHCATISSHYIPRLPLSVQGAYRHVMSL